MPGRVTSLHLSRGGLLPLILFLSVVGPDLPGGNVHGPAAQFVNFATEHDRLDCRVSHTTMRANDVYPEVVKAGLFGSVHADQ